MRRNKRVKTGELPKTDPVKKVYVVTPGIPVQIPQFQPAEIPLAPKKQDLERPR
jgi:hypothetical protein